MLKPGGDDVKSERANQRRVGLGLVDAAEIRTCLGDRHKPHPSSKQVGQFCTVGAQRRLSF